MICRSLFSSISTRRNLSTAVPRPVAAIVGGTKGIGLALGKEWLNAYRRLNPKLFLLGRSTEDNYQIDQLISEYCEGGNAAVIPIQVDLTKSESISEAVRKISNESSHVDFLFHTAGHLHNNRPRDLLYLLGTVHFILKS